MFSETAAALFALIGKETTARGVFTQPQMIPAALALRAAIEHDSGPPEIEDHDDPEERERKRRTISLRQRAWPLIDMLERTSRAGQEANIIWEAAADF